MRVDTVTSGDDLLAALHGAADDPYGVVLLDTGLLGDDLAKWMGRLPVSPASTRLLLLADFDEQVRARAAMELGFHVYLTRPVKQSALFNAIMDAVAEPGADVAAPAHGQATPATRSGTILVAEDNPVNQKLVLHQLRHLGYQAQAVGNGREAVDAFAAPPPGTTWGLILMDCQMPECDGFAATAAIRTMEQGSGVHIPIIAMTANAMEGDREVCLRAGMDDYLPKPVNIAQLKEVLERCLPSTAETPAPPPLDRSVLADLRAMVMDSAPEVIDELIDMFLSDTPRLLTAMHEAISSHDPQALRRAAHSCRGASANLGAARLSALCGEIEQLAQLGMLRDAVECLHRVDAEFRRVAHALEGERSTSRAGGQRS
jgi:CheY-like chemotaxis protein/HPt (histidine-containing phosphotransfer) domain-containing protein